jgi:hypothetical protein
MSDILNTLNDKLIVGGIFYDLKEALLAVGSKFVMYW